jgi:RHS repeat-associated protein
VQFWSGDENSCTLPGCATAAVTIPGGQSLATNVTINYQYDLLDRLVGASYNNGTAFQYTYDAAGNVQRYQSTIGGQTVTTSYSYNGANQQVSAQASNADAIWQYLYDGNGSLVQSMPGDSPANGASRYTYDTAGYLVKVESDDGSSWNPQAQMAYDGLGERLSMTGYSGSQSVTTQYQLDNGQVLAATAGDPSTGSEQALTTTYLYGQGPIGELTDSWAYSLPDGTNTPRQLVDASGKITIASAYTPWGDTLSINGKGNLTFGYFGGIMDTATGLLYVGNGQYYDPSTGRFLNHNAPDPTNPYVPWNTNSSGALIAPLAVLAMIYSRKKGKRSKWDNLIILLVLTMAVSMSLNACSTTIGQTTVTVTPIPQTPNYTVTVTTPTQTSTYIATPKGTPLPTVTSTACPPTPTPLPTVYDGTGQGSTYWFGKQFYNMLDADKSGFWQNLIPGQPFGMETVVAIVLHYELNVYESDQGARNAVAQAFARRFWQAQKDYGPDGAYWYLGGRDMVRLRVNNGTPGIFPNDYGDYSEAIKLTGQIYTNSDWHQGVNWSQPYDWGNPTDQTRKYLPDFIKALTTNPIERVNSNGNQVYYITPDRNFYIVTREQNHVLCNDKSCVSPMGIGAK